MVYDEFSEITETPEAFIKACHESPSALSIFQLEFDRIRNCVKNYHL